MLPGYGSDPRTIDKLMDGVNKHCDDLHSWLAPYTPHHPHYIYVTLDQPTTLGMIRFWVRTWPVWALARLCVDRLTSVGWLVCPWLLASRTTTNRAFMLSAGRGTWKLRWIMC